jgi:hypothetical protein
MGFAAVAVHRQTMEFAEAKAAKMRRIFTALKLFRGKRDF